MGKLGGAVNGVCSCLLHSKSLLRGLLVLTVLVLAYVLVAVAPASATTTLDIGVVRGTDNGVYWNSYSGSWGSWASLGGATLSPPGICEAAGVGTVSVVVRGTDNGIYIKTWSSSAGWGSSWGSPPGGGQAIDQPACAWLSTSLYVVVRGLGGELYWDSFNGISWSGWADLDGQSSSAPVLVASKTIIFLQPRIDLVVQGTNNGIYHKAFTGGAWSSSWDSPGGATLNQPAAALFTTVVACSTPPCPESDFLRVVVRGTDNNVYANAYEMSPETAWATWASLGGSTLSAPTFAYNDNHCESTMSSISGCTSTDALAVLGTDNKVYSTMIFNGWSSAGGSVANSPGLAYVPGSGAEFLLLVEGYPSTALYSNTYTAPGSWTAYSWVGGATNSAPQLVAIV
jgi:hypothetical protein